VNVGGVAIALAKMAAKSSTGATCNVKVYDPRDIFAESFSCAIVEVNNEDDFVGMANEIGIEVEKIGTVGGDTVVCNDVTKSVEAIRERYFNRFAEVIEQDI